MGTGRCRANARSSKVAASAAAVRRGWAWGATASELRHRDRLACLAAAAGTSLFERLRDRATVRVVELSGWIVEVRLVRVEVRQGRDCVRVWLELRSRVGRRGRCVSERTSPCVWAGVEAGPTCSVCWQGDGSVVSVEFWPLNLLICVATSVGLEKKIKKKLNTRRDRSEAKGGMDVLGGGEHALLS